MSTINLTISLDANELITAGNMLLGMAYNIDTPIKTVDGNNLVDDPALAEAEAEAEAEPTPTGVELDNDGLPWDPRIHGAKKLKTAKEQTWKKIRGVESTLVIAVEEELRAALIASPAAAPVVDIPAPTPTPKPKLTITPTYVTDQGNFTEEQLVAVGWTPAQVNALPTADFSTDKPGADEDIPGLSNADMTFPEFMAKITREQAAGEIDQAAVLAAVNAAGLASLPLLATRPDLIAVIDTALFGE